MQPSVAETPQRSSSVASSEVLDGLQHLGHEGRPRTDERRADRSGPYANRCVVGTESTRAQRIVGEFVAVAFFSALAGRLGSLRESIRRDQRTTRREDGPNDELFHVPRSIPAAPSTLRLGKSAL